MRLFDNLLLGGQNPAVTSDSNHANPGFGGPVKSPLTVWVYPLGVPDRVLGRVIVPREHVDGQAVTSGKLQSTVQNALLSCTWARLEA